jgi:hypothetical protein
VVSKDPRIGKQGAAGKRKRVTLRVLQKIYIISGPASSTSCSVVMALCNIRSLTVYGIQEQKDA